jgi:hypothetical protein
MNTEEAFNEIIRTHYRPDGNEHNIRIISMSHSKSLKMPMKLVKQEDKSGCGIACCSMLAGCSYAMAREFWIEDPKGRGSNEDREWRLKSCGDGLDWYEICRLLDMLGVKVPECWETPRILSIRMSDDFDWLRHWVVVDDFGNILDPA